MKVLHNSKPSAKNQRAAMRKTGTLGRDLRIKRAGHCGGCKKLMFIVIEHGQPLDVAIVDRAGFACAACKHTHTAAEIISRCQS